MWLFLSGQSYAYMDTEEKSCIEDWNGPDMKILDSLPHRVVTPIMNKIQFYQKKYCESTEKQP